MSGRSCGLLVLDADSSACSTSLEINHKVKDVIKKHEAGGGVAVKIEHASYESAKQYGRHCKSSVCLVRPLRC